MTILPTMAVNGIDEGGPDNSDGAQYYKLLSGKT